MIDPSQLLMQATGSGGGGGSHSSSLVESQPGRRKVSSVMNNTMGRTRGTMHRHGSIQSNGSGTLTGGGNGGGSASSQLLHQQQQHAASAMGFPSGAQVPAAFYQEVEEQLADALYKRAQAKLMADPDQANVESALGDGLKVRASYSTQYLFACSCLFSISFLFSLLV